MTEKQIFVTAKVPPQLKRDIGKALETGKYLNESDLIRQAIRNLLDSVEAS